MKGKGREQQRGKGGEGTGGDGRGGEGREGGREGGRDGGRIRPPPNGNSWLRRCHRQCISSHLKCVSA
jgi:hypothetical protein